MAFQKGLAIEVAVRKVTYGNLKSSFLLSAYFSQ